MTKPAILNANLLLAGSTYGYSLRSDHVVSYHGSARQPSRYSLYLKTPRPETKAESSRA